VNRNDGTTNLVGPSQHNHDEEIALRAYGLWQERGSPIGSPEKDWFRAEQEICNQGAQPPEGGPSSFTKAQTA